MIIGTLMMYFFSYCRFYQKLGRKSWEAFVPIYNEYVIFEVLYGNGWKVFLFLIPFYNIYLYVKTFVLISREFGKRKLRYYLALIFLPFIFIPVLGLSDAKFRGGAYDRGPGDLFIRYFGDGNNFSRSDCSMNDSASKRVCSVCGRILDDDENFCSDCGTKYEEPSYKLCRNCGAQCRYEDAFCSKCGHSL